MRHLSISMIIMKQLNWQWIQNTSEQFPPNNWSQEADWANFGAAYIGRSGSEKHNMLSNNNFDYFHH